MMGLQLVDVLMPGRVNHKLPLRLSQGLVTSAVILCMVGQTFADSGGVLDIADRRGRVGFDVQVDYRGIESPGYRPVRFRITSNSGGFQRDREIRIVFEYSPSNEADNVSISKIVQLPQGAPLVEVTLFVPQMASWDLVRTRIFEGGDEWREFNRANSLFNSNLPGLGVGYSRTFLVIDSDAPSKTESAKIEADLALRGRGQTQTDPLEKYRKKTLLPKFIHLDDTRTYSVSYPINDADGIVAGQQSATLSLRQPADISENWLAYSCYSAAMISTNDLKMLIEQHPKRWRALSLWLTQRGTLLVYDVGSKFERLPDVEKLLGMRSRSKPAMDSATQESTSPRTLRSVPESTANDLPQEILRGWNQERMVVVRSSSPRRVSLDRTVKPNFLWRRLDLGYVFVINRAAPFPQFKEEKAFDNLPTDHSQWATRHGFLPGADNLNFFDQMIPGVGLPPVTSFLLLISVFVILIGPVNYLYLRKIRRLYLLMVTVPCGALLVTLSLFAYAILSDGLGVQVRARSVTFINQRTNNMATWSRQTYYAAMKPSSGLSFPADTTVFEITPQRRRRRRNSDKPRLTREWTDDAQVFGKGYLKSRSPAQFVVTRAAITDARISVNTEKKSGGLEIRNRLGTQIGLLIVRDADEQYYIGENLEDTEDVVTLSPISTADANARLRLAYASDVLSMDQIHQRRQSSLRNRNRRRRSRRFSSSRSSEQSTKSAESLLERQLYRMQIVQQTLRPRSYVAVVERPPFVPYGVKRPKHVMGLHLVRGVW